MFGPTRIIPGNLSVARTIGDVYTKLTTFGGKPNVISSDPDIFKLNDVNSVDYIFLATDGVYDCLSNTEITNMINSVLYGQNDNNIHEMIGRANDLILKTCLFKQCSDNITSIIIKLNSVYSV